MSQADTIRLAVLWMWDENANRMLTGGLERWCRDLATLCNSHGYEVQIFQKAKRAFSASLSDGISVIGVPCSPSIGGNVHFSAYLHRHFNANDPFIFVSQELALSPKLRRSIAVNHGICWNGDKPWHEKTINRRLQRYLVNNVRAVLCVDTNYINWCHAELPKRTSWRHKLHYIPNYADERLFAGAVKAEQNRATNFHILFPRRVNGSTLEEDGRGAGLLLRAIRLLEDDGLTFKITFAGRGRLQGEIKRWAAVNRLSSEIEVIEAHLDDMTRLYAACDLVVVPTLEQEGTSLSAVEALICGKPLIVSHIGGLPNLVIPNMNGRMCDLSPDSLAEHIRTAYCSREHVDPAITAATRRSLGKARWDVDVWRHVSGYLSA